MNYCRMPISECTQRAIQSEFLEAFKAPTYLQDPDWYEWQNVKHSTSVAIIAVDLRPQAMPTINDVLDRLNKTSGLALSHFQLFVCRPHLLDLYHLDGAAPRRASLNFPLFNCEVGGIEWTHDNAPGAYSVETPFTKNTRTDRTDLPVVDSLVLDHSHIVRVHNWHRINNSVNPNHRVVFSLRFDNNPTFESVVEAFQRSYPQWQDSTNP